jgi:hypothetical protein
VVSPGDWFVSSVLFFCLPVELKSWGEVVLPDHAGLSEILISAADGYVTLQLQMLGQLLPQQCGAVQVWLLPSGSRDHLYSPLVSLLWRWLFAVLVYWDFHAGSLFLCPTHFLWARFSVSSAPSAVNLLWWFTICFSVLQGNLALGAVHWLRRWTLWSTTCPASGSGFSPACSLPFCLPSVCLLIAHTEISTFSSPTPSAVVF